MNEYRRRLIGASEVGTSPAPPVFYDRLVFDGQAFIQTDILLPENCSVAVPLGDESSHSGQNVFSATGGGGTTCLVLGGATNSNARQMVPYYDSTSYLMANRYLNWTYSRYDYFMTPSLFGWGNSTANYTKGAYHPTGGLLLGKWTGSPYTGSMGSFRIFGSDASGVRIYTAFDSYTPVYTLRPCIYKGKAGMWCVETGTFYRNTAGVGSLTVAND